MPRTASLLHRLPPYDGRPPAARPRMGSIPKLAAPRNRTPSTARGRPRRDAMASWDRNRVHTLEGAESAWPDGPIGRGRERRSVAPVGMLGLANEVRHWKLMPSLTEGFSRTESQLPHHGDRGRRRCLPARCAACEADHRAHLSQTRGCKLVPRPPALRVVGYRPTTGKTSNLLERTRQCCRIDDASPYSRAHKAYPHAFRGHWTAYAWSGPRPHVGSIVGRRR